MSEDAPKPRSRKRWWALAGGGALIGAGAFVALGPAAHVIVDHLGDGVRVWRLGRITIDDVSGGWIGNLHAGSVTIEDEEGVWLEAQDLDLDWSPQDILFGAVRLHAARAHSISVARRPLLLESRSSSGAMFDVFIGELHIDRLTLAEPAVGAAAEFSADVALDLHGWDVHTIDLALRRLDSDEDRLTVLYQSGEAYALSLDLHSAPGGVIARALGVSEAGVSASARGRGDANAGATEFSSNVGDAQWLTGATHWGANSWSAEGEAQLEALPALSGIARRLGPSVAFALSAAPDDSTFTAHAETPFLAVDMEGELDEDGALDGPARFIATTQRLSDVARESPFELGEARLQGELRRARGTTAIRATLDAREIDALGQRAQLSGPVEAALTSARFTLTADLRAPDGASPLFANARLRTGMDYNRERGRFELSRSELTSDAIAMHAQGWVTGGDGEFAGEWRIRRLQALVGDLAGEAAGRWRAFAEGSGDARAWAIAIEGGGTRIDGSPEVIPQLLGAAPQLDARLRYENGGITVSHARVDGAQLRAGATGRIVRGEANLALEASARGPLTFGGAEIDGAIDATGRVTGRIARPALSMNGSLSSFAAGGVVVEAPVLSFALTPRGDGYAGRAEVSGVASGQALNGAADIAIGGGAISLTALDAQWGGMQAQGAARFGGRGVNAELDVNGARDGLVPGVRGRLAGELTLTPETILLDAHVADAGAGELRVRAATLRAEGPFSAIATTFDLRGRLRRAPLTFAGTAHLDLEGRQARVDGRGTLAGADIFTRAPMTASWGGGRTEASLNVAVGDGVVQANWEERGQALNGAAMIEDAPIAPLAAIWDERATGRIDGRIALQSSGRGLSGDVDVRLDDARFAGRQRGSLDMRIVGNLTPSRIQGSIDAASTGGLVAHFEASAPVETSAVPIRIALARERRGQASWSVHGPAASLWAAARLQDQSLEGQLDGEGQLEFGAGYLSGDGHLEIIGGRFEDKLTGVTLVDLDARVALDDRGVTIENFTASGPRGGRLTATGGSSTNRQGAITVTLDDMRVADRPDARARASGELTLAWEGLQSTFSGELNILEAAVDIASNPEAGIPTLDVIEINRPGYDDEGEDEENAPRRNGSVTLDIAVTAPGRVYTRGRGVDAEWALDMRLGGTASNPLVFGSATAVRGAISLSGQPFEIEDAVIRFTGDPLDARINMTARRDTADLTAYMRLTGTARAPEITFTSDPPLPEDEILPQILFGRSVEDLSALEAAQLASSLAALSGRASFDLVDAARAATGLDRFAVRQDEDGGFLVAGGVYLTRDVYVEVARSGLGQAQTRVEWTVRPRLVLITSFLGNGDQRVSLRWRRETD